MQNAPAGGFEARMGLLRCGPFLLFGLWPAIIRWLANRDERRNR